MGSVTFYKWRAKYGGINAIHDGRMKELERENSLHTLSRSRIPTAT